MKIAALTIVASLVASAASAEGATYIGAAADSCQAWAQHRRDHADGLWYDELEWVLGYLDAFNDIVSPNNHDYLAAVDTDGIEVWVDRYCGYHPTKRLIDVAAELAAELKTGR